MAVCVLFRRGSDAIKPASALMDIIGDGAILPGVLSCGSGHIRTLNKTPEWSDYWVFTGLTEAQLRAAGVHEGAFAGAGARRARAGAVRRPGRSVGWRLTFDDRMGVVALLRLLGAISAEKFHRPGRC